MRQQTLLHDWGADDTTTRTQLIERIIRGHHDLNMFMVVAARHVEGLEIFEDGLAMYMTHTHQPHLRADILERMRTAAHLEMEQLRPFAAPPAPPRALSLRELPLVGPLVCQPPLPFPLPLVGTQVYKFMSQT